MLICSTLLDQVHSVEEQVRAAAEHKLGVVNHEKENHTHLLVHRQSGIQLNFLVQGGHISKFNLQSNFLGN